MAIILCDRILFQKLYTQLHFGVRKKTIEIPGRWKEHSVGPSNLNDTFFPLLDIWSQCLCIAIESVLNDEIWSNTFYPLPQIVMDFCCDMFELPLLCSLPSIQDTFIYCSHFRMFLPTLSEEDPEIWKNCSENGHFKLIKNPFHRNFLSRPQSFYSQIFKWTRTTGN